jgi:hypothetical protein
MFQGIFQILEQDNVLKEIPLVDRDILEVDVQTYVLGGTVTVSRDFLLKIQMNNVLRRATTNEAPSDFYQTLVNSSDKGLDIFLQVTHMLLSMCMLWLNYFIFSSCSL